MGIGQNMQTLMTYKAMRALEQQVEMERARNRANADLAQISRRRRRRLRAFLDRMLGIR